MSGLPIKFVGESGQICAAVAEPGYVIEEGSDIWWDALAQFNNNSYIARAGDPAHGRPN